MHKFNENGFIGFQFDRINNSYRYNNLEYYWHVMIGSDSGQFQLASNMVLVNSGITTRINISRIASRSRSFVWIVKVGNGTFLVGKSYTKITISYFVRTKIRNFIS